MAKKLPDLWAEDNARDDAVAAVPTAEAAPPALPEPTVPSVRTVPPKDREALQRKIQAGMLEPKGPLQMAGESINEAATETANRFNRGVLFGLPARAQEAAFGPAPQAQPLPRSGKTRRWEDYLPTEGDLAGLPVAATDMATMGPAAGKVGEAIGSAPSALARRLGASEATTAVRPSIQTAANAAGAGAAYGGTDAAMRGGDLQDIESGALTGAAGNAFMSQIPVAAGKVAGAAQNAITSRAVKPLVGIGQGVKADKALAGLGKGDIELGEKEMRRVVEDEGLAPIINSKASKMQSAFDAKLGSVWHDDLGPIREKALAAEPEAKVPIRKIEDKLRELVGKENAGTDVHDDVEKAIALLKSRAEMIGTKGQFPVTNMLKNAQEFERDGFGKSQPKFADGQTARAIGKTLRTLTDERIGQIYAKNPKLVREVIGKDEPELVPRVLETGEPNPDYVPSTPRKPWERTPEDMTDLEILGDKYSAARKRYADLKKLEPLVDQLAKRRAEHRPGLIGALKHAAGNMTAGALGYSVAGQHGVLPAMMAAEGTRLVAPYAERAAASTAGLAAGPAADPGLSGAMVARPGLDAIREAWARYQDKKNGRQ